MSRLPSLLSSSLAFFVIAGCSFLALIYDALEYQQRNTSWPLDSMQWALVKGAGFGTLCVVISWGIYTAILALATR